MEFKNTKELSNSEIQLYMTTLENEYEVLKYKVKEQCDLLEKMGKEYNKAEEELKKRQRL